MNMKTDWKAAVSIELDYWRGIFPFNERPWVQDPGGSAGGVLEGIGGRGDEDLGADIFRMYT